MLDASWRSVSRLSMVRTSSFSACLEAACRWPLRSPRHCGPLSTCSWCANSVCRFSPNWPSAPSARTACGCSTTAVVREAQLDGDDMDAVERKQRIELRRRAERFRRGRDRISLTGRIAVIVDDGIATGATARAACQVARAHGASKVVLAVPIGPDDIVAMFAGYADEVVCLRTPAFFFAVGQGYRHFTQTSDDEVIALLDRARDGLPEAASAGAVDPPLRDEEVDSGGRTGDGGRALDHPRTPNRHRRLRARQREQPA